MRFTDGSLARSDPTALDRVVARSQAPDAQLDETNIGYAFGQALDKGALPIPAESAPLSLTAGVAKIGPITIPSPRGAATVSAVLDLRKLVVETKLAFSLTPTDLKFWSGPPPSATVDVQNALDAPKRELDVSALSAGLAAQAIARETDRIAALEADIRERAFFNRRLKGERFMEERDREIEDWRAEQDRLKGVLDRLRAEEEAYKAAAEKAAREILEDPKAPSPSDHGAAAAKAPSEDGAATVKGSFAPAPAKNNDELGANASPSPPTPPTRPRARPATPDPTQGGIY
jgi:hypothetical protein